MLTTTSSSPSFFLFLFVFFLYFISLLFQLSELNTENGKHEKGEEKRISWKSWPHPVCIARALQLDWKWFLCHECEKSSPKRFLFSIFASEKAVALVKGWAEKKQKKKENEKNNSAFAITANCPLLCSILNGINANIV